MVSVRDVFENACQQIDIRNPVSSAHVLAKDLDSMTLEEWVQSKGMGSPSLAVVSIWTRAMLGVEPSEMSALYFLDYCNSGGGLSQMRSDRKHGGQYMRIKQGTAITFMTCFEALLTTSQELSHSAKAWRLGCHLEP